jgi:hypothetical protein
MAFTQAQLQTELDSAGLNCIITKFDNTSSASFTDVGVQNMNTSAKKTGIVQVDQSNTAAQAAAAILTALT